MLLSSKKTRLFALCTLATTFVYYRYSSSPRGEQFRPQFNGSSEVLTDLTASSADDIQGFLTERRGQGGQGEPQEEKGSDHEQAQESDSKKPKENLNVSLKEDKIEEQTQEGDSATPKENIDISFKEANIEDVTDGYANTNTEEQKKDTYPNSTTSQFPTGEEKEDSNHIIIVNNKVYRKNDTIPMKPIKFPVLWPSSGRFLKNIDLDGYSKKESKFLKNRLKEMVARTKKVAKVCNARTKLIVPQNLHLIWDRQHTPNIVWCPLYKVASTSWMINFLRLAHFNEDNPLLKDMNPAKREKFRFKPKYGARQDAVYTVYPQPADRKEFLQTFKSSLRVIIVRHPFTRILSAYRDKMIKLEPRPTEFHFRDLQLQIIAKYRPVDSPESSQFPTFSEFVQYILDSTKTFVTAQDWKKNVHCWTPYWAQCNVCGVDYNVIIKLETMTEDEKFLITISNLEELKELKSQEWRHLNNATSMDVAPEFYSQLSRTQIKQLYQRYLLDFLLFDYKIDDIYTDDDEE
ncbi:carbohydrate sulfotransferase 11-like [Macrobrachium rosenbergii]|uniref:carbohydrate sulfotransferase 11-like n=1 Tax=Macrobrachium rosenbergii TaxID=79674 RepID=UPI0034D5EF2B